MVVHMKKRYKYTILVWVLMLFVLSGCAGGNGKTQDDGAVEKASQAQNGSLQETEGHTDMKDAAQQIVFEGQDLSGNAVSSDIFSNAKLTMVNVWATYCNPCLSEMPHLGELAAEYDSGDFQIIGIVSDVQEGAEEDNVKLAASLVEETGAGYPHLLLNESLYYALLTEVSAVPTTFFIDQEGNVLDTVIGARDKEGWKEKIDGFLEGQ